MTVPLIGTKKDQETIICIVIPGMPRLWARKTDIQWKVLPLPCPIPGRVGEATLAPIPFLYLATAWSDINTAYGNIESFGGASLFADKPSWWDQRPGQQV